MAGTDSNDDHPRIAAQAAPGNYAPFASAKVSRRLVVVRTALAAERRAVNLEAASHYNALVKGDVNPADVRAAVGLY